MGVQIATRPTWALQKIPPEGCCFWRKQPCSPGRASYFMTKAWARLGELPWSQMPFFAINRHKGELRKGFQGSKGEGIERRKKRKQSWGTTESRLWSISTSFLVWCSSCDHRLVLFFLRLNVIYVPLGVPPCYYVHIHLLHLSSTISFSFVKFNLNRSLVL